MRWRLIGAMTLLGLGPLSARGTERAEPLAVPLEASAENTSAVNTSVLEASAEATADDPGADDPGADDAGADDGAADDSGADDAGADDAGDEDGASLVFEVELATYWNYLWRGTYVWKDTLDVEPALTVGVDTAGGSVELAVWAGIPVMSRDDLEEVRDEVDFTLSWSKEFGGRVTPSVGITAYTVIAQGFHTEEVFVTADVTFPLGFTASGGLWADVNQLKGLYYRVAALWSHDFVERLTLELELYHGAARYVGEPVSVVEAVGSRLGLSVALGAGLSLGANLGFTYNPGGEDDTLPYAAGLYLGYAYGDE